MLNTESRMLNGKPSYVPRSSFIVHRTSRTTLARSTSMKRTVSPVIALSAALLLASSCATRDGATLTDDPALSSFLERIGTHLENHQWDAVIDQADPDHYRTQVQEVGLSEPQYIAELFGLHSPGNNIETGERPSRADLERIDTVEWTDVERSGDRIRAVGTARLNDGTSMNLQAQIVERDGDFRLTGGVG